MDGVALHHHEYGDPTGPALVALHGVRGHGERWQRFAETHLAGFRVYGLDLRGHGRSDWRPPWSIAQHVADVLADAALARARAEVSATSFATPVMARAERVAGTWGPVPGELVDAEVSTHLDQSKDGRWRWRYEPVAVVTAYSELVEPLPPPPPGLPTLLVAAVRGSTVPACYADACRAALGDLFAVTVVDSAHLVYLEQPDQTGAAVREFLAGLSA
jgi:lipase